MTKRKKKNPKRIIITISSIVTLLIASFFTQLIIHKNNTPIIYSKNINYIKGKINSLNASANILDSLYEGENILISPINANIALSILYNGADNNSEKEINKYFGDNQENTNNIFLNKLNKLTIKNNNPKKEKYEKSISTLFNRNYHKLTNQEINRLSQKEKDDLLLILRKIELYYEQSRSKAKDKDIEKYNLTDKERASNSYVIKERINKILIQYEKYLINNKAINYNELFVNKNKSLQINKNYSTISKKYKANITQIDYKEKYLDNINNNLTSATDNTMPKVLITNELTSKDIISINSFVFNSKWQEEFRGEYNTAEEFTDYSGNHYLVDMMYNEEQYYLENDEAYGFAKNFEDERYSFVGILPKETKEFKLSNIDLDKLFDSKKKTKVNVGLPKFEIESTNNLIKLFEQENIKGIFSDKANLHLMSNQELKVGVMLQQEAITIGEYGTVESKNKNTSLSTKITEHNSIKMIFNKPFAFLIIDNETNDVLLIGRFNKPNQK